MSKNRQYSNEFKERIIKECQKTGNISLVALRHEISPNTDHSWMRKYRRIGSVGILPKDDKIRQ